MKLQGFEHSSNCEAEHQPIAFDQPCDEKIFDLASMASDSKEELDSLRWPRNRDTTAFSDAVENANTAVIFSLNRVPFLKKWVTNNKLFCSLRLLRSLLCDNELCYYRGHRSRAVYRFRPWKSLRKYLPVHHEFVLHQWGLFSNFTGIWIRNILLLCCSKVSTHFSRLFSTLTFFLLLIEVLRRSTFL